MAKKISIIVAITVCFLAVAGVLALDITQIPGAQDNLKSAQQELAVMQSDLTATQAELASTKDQLSDTKADNTATLDELTQTTGEVADINAEISTTRESLSQSQTRYTAALAKLNDEKAYALKIQTDIGNTQTNITSLDTGYGYVLNDPTYAEVKAFILADLTNLKTGSLIYTTVNFAHDVQQHALEQHIHCCFIDVRFTVLAERIVGFNTTDRGMVYFEPQTDEEIILQAGKHYWRECVISKWGVPYQDPASYSDIIKDWVIIW